MINTGDSSVNKDQFKGAARDVGGKLQQKAGKLVGSDKQQAKGLAKQISGKIRKGVGDVREALEDATRKD